MYRLMQTLMNKFEDFLIRKDQRFTGQRQLIARTFFKHKGHISAEELYDRIKKQTPSIGFATVYRTLKLLCEAGLASHSNFRDGVSRFEATASKEHHDHLICTTCGKIVEFTNYHIETMQDQVAAEHGFLVRDHTLDIYGTCGGCRGKTA